VLGVAALVAAITGLWLIPTTHSSAQVQEGATMTVLRGQVAVVRSDGSAIQPAPSGTIVNPGDEIRTLGSTSALITFFAGTEIELGQNTTIAIEQVSRQGDRIDVSLRQVFGTTINRIQTLTANGSAYRIEAGGAVALVRGTTFALIGPITTSVGNIVILVCGDDCGPTSSFAGCPLQPFLGYGVLVDRGRVESPCMPFAVARTADLTSAAYEAITTIEQQLQGDTGGVPAGQVQSGQQQEIESRNRRRENEDDDKPNVAPSPIAPPVAPSPSTLPTASINDVSVPEGTNATFTVTLSAASSQPVTVNFATANGTAVAPGDYTATSGTLTFPPGTTTQTIAVPIVLDTAAPATVGAAAVEPPETFFVNLSGAVGATIADGQGQGTILDPVTLTLAINDVPATEGGTATFTVSLSAPSSQPVTVNFATANGTAVAPGDYTAASGTLTIPVGSTAATVVVPTVADAIDELDETFVVNLSGATVATIADSQGVGTIVDDDPPPTISIADASVNPEGTGTTATATFTVSISAASGQTVAVNFATADGPVPGGATGGGACGTAGVDYVSQSGTLSFPPGSTTQTVSVTTCGDAIDELDETFFVNLSGPSNATIADGQGTGAIADDDTASLSINDVTQDEGNDCADLFGLPVGEPCGTTDFVFTVTLSTPSDRTVTVDFTTSDGGGLATATGGASGSCAFMSSDGGTDYETTSGTLTFTPGDTSETVTVLVCADVALFWGFGEEDETFFVDLSNPTGGATITDDQGQGTILDDDDDISGGV
jgi:hypothetical protein